jgi:hydroxyacylglutathione hydrolase
MAEPSEAADMGVRIDTVRVGVNNIFLLRERGAILIDTGPRPLGRTVLRKLRRVVDDLHDIRLLIATHGHFDHIGAAPQLRAATGAPLTVHDADAEWVRSATFYWPDGVTPWGRFSRRVLGPVMVPLFHLAPVEVDMILTDEGLDLDPFGVPGKVVHTPGHSPGSVSVVLPSGDAFVGDLAMNGPPMCLRPSFGIYADDPDQVPASWRRLLDLGMRTAYPAHGRPFPAARLAPERKRARHESS